MGKEIYIVAGLSVWILLFGVRFETEFVKVYINGIFKKYNLDEQSKPQAVKN